MENLLEDTDGCIKLEVINYKSACYTLLLLTCALLMTSSHSEGQAKAGRCHWTGGSCVPGPAPPPKLPPAPPAPVGPLCNINGTWNMTVDVGPVYSGGLYVPWAACPHPRTTPHPSITTPRRRRRHLVLSISRACTLQGCLLYSTLQGCLSFCRIHTRTVHNVTAC